MSHNFIYKEKPLALKPLKSSNNLLENKEKHMCNKVLHIQFNNLKLTDE